MCTHLGNSFTRGNEYLQKHVQKKEMRYYLLDYGKEMLEASKKITEYLEREGFHYIAYLTNADGLLCLEEIDEDEFLNHFKNTKQNV
jgi:hypothetical protein